MSVSFIKPLQFVNISFENTGLVMDEQNLFAPGRPRVAPCIQPANHVQTGYAKFYSSNTDMSIVVWGNLLHDLGQYTTSMLRNKYSLGLSILVSDGLHAVRIIQLYRWRHLRVRIAI